MFRKLITPAAACLAAAATTLSVFSAVAGLADGDRAYLLAAKHSPTLIAVNAASDFRRDARVGLDEERAETSEIIGQSVANCCRPPAKCAPHSVPRGYLPRV